MSYLHPLKAGEERYSEPLILCENERFALFVQCDQIDEQMKDWGWKVLDCVRRYFDEILNHPDSVTLEQVAFVLSNEELTPKLFAKADEVRRNTWEQKSFSGHYRILQLLLQQLLYCGIRAQNKHVHRYRMTPKKSLTEHKS